MYALIIVAMCQAAPHDCVPSKPKPIATYATWKQCQTVADARNGISTDHGWLTKDDVVRRWFAGCYARGKSPQINIGNGFVLDTGKRPRYDQHG